MKLVIKFIIKNFSITIIIKIKLKYQLYLNREE